MAQTVKSLNALAVVLERPGELTLRSLPLPDPGAEDAVVDMLWSGISTGTERLLWSGAMPPFPGMGYPLVPGYESVGRVVLAGERSQRRAGEHVFVPGARCYGAVRGLFGGAASRVVVPGARLLPVDERLGERAVLMALAATAYHAVHAGELPQLIVGHGVLGRLVARLCVLAGVRPVVWESDPARREACTEYAVMDPGQDDRHDYASVCDVSGDASLLDTLVQRLAPGGEIVLAGFYSERLSFAFPPAFMREARLRVAAEWKPADLAAVTALAASGALCLDGLITHRRDASQAHEAYRTAFEDSRCLKMILDWRTCG